MQQTSTLKNFLRHIKYQLVVKFKPRTNRVYTQFYRFPNQYKVLVDRIVPEIIDSSDRGTEQNPLEILMFACCTGEEAFSLAHVLQKHFPELNFRIRGFDIVEEVVAKAKHPEYTREQVYQGDFVTEEFVREVFDIEGDRYRVKKALTDTTEFAVGDMMDNTFIRELGKADMVIAQNVLFHLPPPNAKVAFEHLTRLLEPHSALFINGMDTDMRIKLTKRFNLAPVEDRIEEIHNDARVDRGNGWAGAYWGRAPFSTASNEWVRKYCTIYKVNAP